MLEDDCNAAPKKEVLDSFDGRIAFIIYCKYRHTTHSVLLGPHKLPRFAHNFATVELSAAAKTTDFMLYLQTLLYKVY